MYENMKAKDAAKIFDRLDIKVLLEVATQINPRRMSDILAQMSPEAAERLTVELATRAGSDRNAKPAELPKIEGRPSGDASDAGVARLTRLKRPGLGFNGRSRFGCGRRLRRPCQRVWRSVDVVSSRWSAASRVVLAVAAAGAAACAERGAGPGAGACAAKPASPPTGGYGRIVITLADEVESQVRMTSGILVIQFKQPVTSRSIGSAPRAANMSARRAAIPTAARLRFALAQKVKVSSMAAGDRLFVDLLPESWTGEPPGLPREVVEELAQARAARPSGMCAAEARGRSSSSKMPAGAGAGRGAADLHALHLRIARADRRHRRARQGQADADLRQAAAVRSGRRQAALPPKAVDRDRRQRQRRHRRGAASRSRRQADVRTFREDFNYVVDVSPIERQAGACAGRRRCGRARSPA